MSHDELAERDTVPPSPDPLIPYVERIEGKIDKILHSLAALTTEVFRLGAKEREQDEEIGIVRETVRKFTPAAGMPAVHPPGNGNGGGE